MIFGSRNVVKPNLGGKLDQRNGGYTVHRKHEYGWLNPYSISFVSQQGRGIAQVTLTNGKGGRERVKGRVRDMTR